MGRLEKFTGKHEDGTWKMSICLGDLPYYRMTTELKDVLAKVVDHDYFESSMDNGEEVWKVKLLSSPIKVTLDEVVDLAMRFHIQISGRTIKVSENQHSVYFRKYNGPRLEHGDIIGRPHYHEE